ncbi:MAG: PepSY domain-containing protein [Clostridiales bacterium]|nr:PepSY domain-containing protein [Clostridiales bacterium]
MLKKFLSSVLCIFIAFQAVPVCGSEDVFEEDISSSGKAYGEDNAASEGDVSELITYTKKLLGIGSNYDEFDYTYTINENTGLTSYTFSWNDTTDSTSVDAAINSDKYIYRYVKYNTGVSGLGTLTEEEARTSAESFLKLVVPEEYIENVKYEKTENRNSSAAYRFTYRYVVNGIPLNGGDCTVNISKINGEVIYYYAPSEAPFYYDYSKAENIISAEDAHNIYRDFCEPVFEYRDYYDSEEKMYKAFPAYYLTDISSYMIDAFTGECIENEYYDSFEAASGSSNSYYADLTAETVEEEDSYKLTEAETASIEDKEGLLTPEEALAYAEKGIYIADKTNLRSTLRKESDEYIWSLRIENENTNVSFNINASTGEVLFYSNRSGIYRSETVPDYEAMLKAAEKTALAFSGDRFNDTELEYEEISYDDYDINGYRSYSFKYVRKVNGIKYRDNYLLISFDAAGVIDEYDCRWFENAEFPDIDGAIGTAAAYAKLFNISEPKLEYIKTDSGVSLVYMFDYGSVCLDKEGNRIDPYKGTPYKEEEAFPGYTDIDGSKYEDIIKLLYNNGYYIEREEFKPDEPISPEDFAAFFRFYGKETEKGFCIYGYNNAPDKYYGDTLTRYETAEILAYANVSSSVLNIPDIYTADYYKDEIDREYLPCVAVCYGLGYMTGDENNCFNGNDILTNGEAAVILYNTLTSKN